MKAFLSLIFIFFSVYSNSQHLNKLGQIEIDEIPTMPEYRIQKLDNVYKVIKDSFIFEGNTYYKISDGFLTSLEIFDNEKDYIKHYDSKGNLLVTILTDRIINLKTSTRGKELAFHNSNEIICIDLNTYQVDTISGSFVYAFINDDFIFYNSDNKTINFKNLQIEIKEYPNQFVAYKDKILVITKQNIYELTGNSLFHKYEFKGQFFDAKLIGEEFYFVDKTEKRKSESFSLYKTSDFNQFLLVDRLDDLNR